MEPYHRYTPEIKELMKELEGALIDPELIKRSVYNKNVVLFYRHYKHIYRGKYMCVVVRLDDKSIVTAYITDIPPSPDSHLCEFSDTYIEQFGGSNKLGS